MNMMRRICVIMMLQICCVSLTVAMSCPYDAPTCKCSLKTVTCTNLKNIPTLRNGSDVIAVTEAHFLGGNISIIPDNSLPPGLIVLEFENIQLNDVSDGAFQESANTLNTFSITNSKLRKLPSALFKLTNLTNLNIENSLIEDWNSDALQHTASTVNTLKLRNVSLTVWPDWLTSFSSLISVDLGLNSLQSIPENAFEFSKATLGTLTLDTCKLNQIPKALSVLGNVTFLSLENNNITSLTTSPHLSNMTRLEYLLLSNNQISDANRGSFPPALNFLFLNNNKLTSIPAGVEDLSMLSYLFLSYNLITEIRFDKLPLNLTFLDIQHNKISEIRNDNSANTKLRLSSLSLSYNPIKTISPSAFRNLSLLGSLYLYNSSLTEIPLALTSLTSLRSLGLPPLPCPCPPPKELVAWYKSRMGIKMYNRCTTGGNVDDYLRDVRQSNSPCDAHTLACCVWCRLSCLLVLLATIMYL